MKATVVLVALAMVLMVSFTGLAYAQDGGNVIGPNELFQQKMSAAKTMNFEGTVLSHDVSCHCVVLKTAKGNLTLQDDYAKFEGDYNRAKGLKVGSNASGTYKSVDYINYIVSVRQ